MLSVLDGPWEVHNNGDSFDITYHDTTLAENIEGNHVAALMAAAPELLVVAERFLPWIESENLEDSPVRAGPCWCEGLNAERIPGPCGFCALDRARATIAKARGAA